jgi:hypothetical protein
MPHQRKVLTKTKRKARDGFGETVHLRSSYVKCEVLTEGNRMVMMDAESEKELANMSVNCYNLLKQRGYLKHI